MVRLRLSSGLRRLEWRQLEPTPRRQGLSATATSEHGLLSYYKRWCLCSWTTMSLIHEASGNRWHPSRLRLTTRRAWNLFAPTIWHNATIPRCKHFLISTGCRPLHCSTIETDLCAYCGAREDQLHIFLRCPSCSPWFAVMLCSTSSH